MDDNVELVRRKLCEAAKDRRLVHFEEVGEWVGRPAIGVGPILNAVNEAQTANGGPLLSALVVRKPTGPGEGFFVNATQLGRRDDEMTDDEFWLTEVCRIFDTCGTEGQCS